MIVLNILGHTRLSRMLAASPVNKHRRIIGCIKEEVEKDRKKLCKITVQILSLPESMC